MKSKIARLAEKAEDRITAAYWAACDELQAAVDPSEMGLPGWAEDLLQEQYDMALRMESDPLGWEEGRAKW
jgi:hypothetical protein